MFILPLAAVMMIGCTNLDETIYDQVAAEYYEFTEQDSQAMLAPMYEALLDVYSYNGLPDLQDESTDLWCVPYRIGVGWGTYYIVLHRHTFHANISHCRNIWNNCYAGITTCNQLMEDDAVAGSEASMAALRGFRAFFYYVLFDNFRNIPLDKTFTHEDGWLATQAEPQESWDWIISELNDIKEKVGEDNGFGKINKYAVCMLLAKMYLNHEAWFHDGDMSYYKKAVDEVNEVINSGKFSLSSDYFSNFEYDLSSNPEVIFGLPCEYKYAGYNQMANLWMNNSGRKTWGFTGWATGGGACLTQFLDTYDEDDERLNCWIWGQQYDANGNEIYEGEDPLIYTRELHTIDGCYPMDGARMTKWEIRSGSYGTYYDDLPIFRYADALMIKAECLLRLGGYNGESEQDAADLVTMVRQRNFTDNPEKAVRTVEDLKGGSVYKYGLQYNTAELDADPVWVTTEEGGDDIILGGLLDDLAWEFLGECHRRQDLIRFQMTDGRNVYNGKSWFCKEAITDPSDHHLEIFPIYQKILDANMNLKQNPGY